MGNKFESFDGPIKSSKKEEEAIKRVVDNSEVENAIKELKTAGEIAVEKTGGPIPKKEERMGRDMTAAELAMKKADEMIAQMDNKPKEKSELPESKPQDEIEDVFKSSDGIAESASLPGSGSPGGGNNGNPKYETQMGGGPGDSGDYPTCPNCGKKILPGKEEYHRTKQCLLENPDSNVLKVNSHIEFGPGVTIEDLENELARKEKELQDLEGTTPDNFIFKDTFSREDIEKTIENNKRQLKKEIERLKKEIEKMKADAEREKILSELNAKLLDAQENLEKAKMSAKPMEIAYWEDIIKKIKEEISKYEKGIIPGAIDAIKKAFESFKDSNAWGFIKERAKGFGTFGFWEFHQAERLRSGTAKTGKTIEEQAKLISEEKHLDLNAALEEASHMEKVFDAAGIDPTDRRKEEYDLLSEKITDRKKQENEVVIKKIIDGIPAALESRNVQKYREANTGKIAMTPEKIKDLQEKIRIELEKMKDGTARQDVEKYATVMRRGLDPKWWSRYIYGGLETALDAIGVKLILSKVLAEKSVAAVSEKAPGLVSSHSSAEKSVEIGMRDNVWNESRRFLVKEGISNPSNKQVLEAARTVAQESGVTVPEWGINGHILSTKMPAGYLLKMGGVIKKLLMIKSLG